MQYLLQTHQCLLAEIMNFQHLWILLCYIIYYICSIILAFGIPDLHEYLRNFPCKFTSLQRMGNIESFFRNTTFKLLLLQREKHLWWIHWNGFCGNRLLTSPGRLHQHCKYIVSWLTEETNPGAAERSEMCCWWDKEVPEQWKAFPSAFTNPRAVDVAIARGCFHRCTFQNILIKNVLFVDLFGQFTPVSETRCGVMWFL